MVGSEIILPAILFMFVAMAAYFLLNRYQPYQQTVRRRLAELGSDSHASSQDMDERKVLAEPQGGFSALLEGIRPILLADSDDAAKLFQKAGTYDDHLPKRLLRTRLILAIIPFALVFTLGQFETVSIAQAAFLASAAAAVGFYAPIWWLKRSIKKRHIKLGKALPDFLDLMIVCLEGGLSIPDAMRRVTEELQLAHPILAMELRIVQQDIELGASLDVALRKFGLRAEYDGIRILASFIRETQRFGTNITEALRQHSDMLRTEAENRAEERAQKAAVTILLPTLLLLFPAMFVVLVGPAVIQIKEAFAGRILP